MTNLKKLALALFAKVYGIRTASTYLVKKQFPKFRASLKDHWEFLIIKLLRIYREQQENLKKEQTPESFLDPSKLLINQLRQLAESKGINPNQPRFRLLQALGYEQPKAQPMAINAGRSKAVRQDYSKW